MVLFSVDIRLLSNEIAHNLLFSVRILLSPSPLTLYSYYFNTQFLLFALYPLALMAIRAVILVHKLPSAK